MKFPKHPAIENALGNYSPNGMLVTEDKSRHIQRVIDKSDWLKELEDLQAEARARGGVTNLRPPKRQSVV